MKIERIGEKKIIMSAPNQKNNYFAWPSVKRLQDGRIAVGASGFRLRHICPFGKAVMITSKDEGECLPPCHRIRKEKRFPPTRQGLPCAVWRLRAWKKYK